MALFRTAIKAGNPSGDKVVSRSKQPRRRKTVIPTLLKGED